MIKLITGLLLFSSIASATLNDVEKAQIWPKNLHANGGFESGKGMWTASAGTFSIATNGTNLLTGKASGNWDAAAATNTLGPSSSQAYTIPKGLYGRNGVVACKFMVPSGTATHTLEAYDGSTVLGSVTITSSTTPTYSYANFIFPSSGTIGLRIQAQADEPNIAIDDCFLGDAAEINLTNISQAKFIGSAYFATTASCAGWARTNTALGSFSTDSDCPGPTVEFNPGPGVIQTTDTDSPKVTLNNLPPGFLQVIVTGIGVNTGGIPILALNDGTTTAAARGGFNQAGSANDQFSVNATFQYTSAGNRTIELYGSASANAIQIHNDANNKQLHFSFYWWPLTIESAVNAASLPASWNGYHDNTCVFTRTNTVFGNLAADATCVFTERQNRNFGTVSSYLSGSDKLPGIVFTPGRPGRYFVCASPIIVATGNQQNFQLSEVVSGTVLATNFVQISTSQWVQPTLCGIFNAATITAHTVRLESKANSGSSNIGVSTGVNSIEWSITALDQAMPAPVLVNSVVSPVSGVMKIFSLNYTGGNPPTINRNDGSVFSYTSRAAAGAYLWAIAAGTCSTVPNCTISCRPGTAASLCFTQLDTTGAAHVARTSTAIQTFGGQASSGSDSHSGDLTCVCQP
jgi:hypothetical protein